MARLLGESWEADVRVRWYADDATGDIHVERWQDPQAALDMVAAANSDGAKTIDGLGKPVVEVPITVAMAVCNARGIPWEKFLYGTDDDGSLERLGRE